MWVDGRVCVGGVGGGENTGAETSWSVLRAGKLQQDVAR